MNLIDSNVNFMCEIAKLPKLDRKLLLLTLEILETNDTINIDNLGSHQLSLIGNLIVDSYSSKKIQQTENNSLLQSTVVYDNFIGWCNENKLSEKILNYFTHTRFTQLLGKKYIQKRTSDGKFWKNIILIDDNGMCNQSIGSRLKSIYESNFGSSYKTMMDNTNLFTPTTDITCDFTEYSEKCGPIVSDLEETYDTATESITNIMYLDIHDFCLKHQYTLKFVRCTCDELIFVIVNSHRCLQMKIIPYKRKSIVNSLDYLNDMSTMENRQIVISKLLNKLVEERQTPHINLHIAHYYTTLATFTNLNKSEVVDKDDEQYNKFESKYNLNEFETNALVLISENCDGGTLSDFIKKYYKKFTLLHWKVIFFQIISTLAVIQSKYPSFTHGNFRASELFVTKTSNKNTLACRINKNNYKLANIGYLIKIDNFAHAKIDNIAQVNRYYDMHNFFKILSKTEPMSDPVIPIEVTNFINRIVPNKYMSNAHDEYLLPSDVLLNDEFFLEFKKC